MAELVQSRYAKSLFEVAVGANCQDEIMEQLTTLDKVISENPEFLKLLAAKNIGKKEIKDISSHMLESRVSEFITNLIKIMIDNGRVELITKVVEAYKQIYYEHKGIIEVTAVTAVPLSSTSQENLAIKLGELTGKTPMIKNVVDGGIIGGMILKVNNEQMDNSVKRKLNDLKKQLSTLTM